MTAVRFNLLAKDGFRDPLLFDVGRPQVVVDH
jgi:hypothetical protein